MIVKIQRLLFVIILVMNVYGISYMFEEDKVSAAIVIHIAFIAYSVKQLISEG